MQRPPLPAFIRDLGAEPAALRSLLVAAVSMGAAGLNPNVTSPGLPSIQSAIRAQPDINGLIVGVTIGAAALLFVGGFLGDTDGRRGILLGALAVLIVTGALGIAITSGQLFFATRLAGSAAAYAVLPFALALVATAYRGVTRATAIGIVYAAYGAATAASPALLTIFGPSGATWPAFLACVVVASIALWIAWRRTPNLPAIARHERAYVASTAVWAMAIVILTVGVMDLGNRLAGSLRIALIGVGLAMVVGYLIWDRRIRKRGADEILHVSRRPITVAVAVGVIVGFAQAAPLFQLPLFFDLVLRYGPLGATLATAPFIIALIVAGPVAGSLLTRFRPRTLVAGGLVAVGLGNVAAAAVLGQDVPYLALVVPMAGIGAGFVVATTVRTAIIFASVSRGLPATAAALNEASLLVGSRIGLTALTAIITQRALDLYSSSLSTLETGARDAAVKTLREILVAIGTPGLAQLAGSINQADLAAYVTVFVQAYRESLFGTGLIALIAAPIVWLALGARDPLTTVWDHLDERTGDAAVGAASTASTADPG
jgi:DHA2 family multidrug resistance protein-like MFS transporter